MGIINVTPDSFSDGGQFVDIDRAYQQAMSLIADGAHILDIGGESTRPGALSVTAEQQCQRVLPLIERLAAAKHPVALSIDTTNAVVAEKALQAGADLVNDVSGLSDPQMADVVAEQRAAIILMHMRGQPHSMQQGSLHYDDVTTEVIAYLRKAQQKAVNAGIARTQICVDPGLGFGKTAAHNCILTKQLKALQTLESPIVYGASRKQFLGKITAEPDPQQRDLATAISSIAAWQNGAQILRVHNVKASAAALKIWQALHPS